MLRHRLASLFEPRNLVVITDRSLPLVEQPPRWLKGAMTVLHINADEPPQLPATLPGVAAGGRVDQALVCVPAQRLPQVLQAVRSARPRSLVLLSHPQMAVDQAEEMAYCLSWAKLNDCLLLGPRAFGVQRPHLGLNSSHQPSTPLGGRVALVAQSRSITAAVLDWAADISLGFSAVVSPGDESVVDVADLLDYLALDARTDSIVLYLEETASSRRFTSALRAAASVKPVVVLKVGHSVETAEHEAVFNALLSRAGAVRVQYFIQMFSALKVLVYTRRPRGRKIALYSNGTGPSRLALDVMGTGQSVFRADLAQTTVKALRDVLEPGAETTNPVVSFTGLQPDILRKALGLLVDDPGVDGVLVVLAPEPMVDMQLAAQALADMASESRKPIITCFMGDASMRDLRHVLDRVGTPAFRTPESAANAFGILGAYHYNQTLSQQTLPPEPLSKPPLLEQARGLLHQALDARQRQLAGASAMALLQCFHIPVQQVEESGRSATGDADEPASMAIHVRRDAKFGPYIAFGAGSDLTPLASGNQAIELPPLNRYLARKLVQRSLVWRRSLSRDMTPVAFEQLLDTLEGVSEMISELPDIDTLAIDPLIAEDDHLLAVQVRVSLSGSHDEALILPEKVGYRHMAIHPYPRHLVQAKTFTDGRPWMLRPIRPEDAEPLQTFVRELSDESRYMRFVSMLRELTPRMLARYTRIDYDRELALVATIHEPNPDHRGHPREQIVGFSHYLRNPDGRGAEYALVIADTWQRHGLGMHLMNGLIAAAQVQGLTYIDGLVLASNRPMLKLMTRLGFKVDIDEEDPGMRRVWLDLGETARA
jgi:acetyltransferase